MITDRYTMEEARMSLAIARHNARYLPPFEMGDDPELVATGARREFWRDAVRYWTKLLADLQSQRRASAEPRYRTLKFIDTPFWRGRRYNGRIIVQWPLGSD